MDCSKVENIEIFDTKAPDNFKEYFFLNINISVPRERALYTGLMVLFMADRKNYHQKTAIIKKKND